MTWIESHTALRMHPKTTRAARSLGINRYELIGYLMGLWWWAVDYAEDGELSGYDAAEIADGAGWEGDPSLFLEALVGAGGPRHLGFVERDDAGLRLHDWDDYAGKLIDQRAANARRQQAYRKREKAKRDTDAQPLPHEPITPPVTNEQRNAHVTVTSPSRNPATGPDRTGPDLPLTNVSGAAEPNEPDAPAGAPPDGGHSLIDLLKHVQEQLAEPKAQPAKITGQAFTTVFGIKANYGLIAGLLRDYDAPFEIVRLMVQIAPRWNGSDDPHRYLAAALRNKRAPPNGRAEPHYLDATEAEERRKEDLAWTNKVLGRSASPPPTTSAS